MIFEVAVQAIKISFFSNCGSHHCLYTLSNCQKGKFCFKMVFETVISAIKNIFFFVIVGPIIAYISHQNYQKRNFYFKMWLSKLPFLVIVGPTDAYISHQIFPKRKFYSKMWSLKISFFGNCGFHCCLYQPSNFPKKEIPFLEGHCQPHIKLFSFLDCGSTFPFLELPFLEGHRQPHIKLFPFLVIVGPLINYVIHQNFLF